MLFLQTAAAMLAGAVFLLLLIATASYSSAFLLGASSAVILATAAGFFLGRPRGQATRPHSSTRNVIHILLGLFVGMYVMAQLGLCIGFAGMALVDMTHSGHWHFEDTIELASLFGAGVGLPFGVWSVYRER